MKTLKVKTDDLKFRSSPEISETNIQGSLTLAQSVEFISGKENDRFWAIKAMIDGTTKQGFASAKFLRPLVSDRKEALISAVVQEWLQFDRGKKKETDSTHVKIVGEYWKSIGTNDRDGNSRDQPWSAAFISSMMKKTGYADFLLNESHSAYVHDAFDKRKTGDASAPFWAFNVGEHKPQLGDLVCKTREDSNFSSMDTMTPGFFKSHCDVIVEIRDTEVRGIGGNVRNSVAVNVSPLDSGGFLKQGGTERVYGILGNNL
jgi:hypothetical protein